MEFQVQICLRINLKIMFIENPQNQIYSKFFGHSEIIRNDNQL